MVAARKTKLLDGRGKFHRKALAAVLEACEVFPPDINMKQVKLTEPVTTVMNLESGGVHCRV